MSEPQGNPPGNVIRITRSELDDPHVDDLLKRQASLRGEGGISRDRRGAWYHRSYFILMIAGAIGAFASWAIVEPFFDDLIYIQGNIEAVALNTSAAMLKPGESRKAFKTETIGTLTVQGKKVYLLNSTLVKRADGALAALDPKQIVTGDSIGLFADSDREAEEEEKEKGAWYAPFVALRPPPPQNLDDVTFDRAGTRHALMAMLLLPLTAGLVGLLIGAADGIACRLLRRALLGGTIGLIVGFIGGFLATFLAGLVYMPLTLMALHQRGSGVAGMSAWGFALQLLARGTAWGIAGTAMGLGHGIALRSGRLVLYGFLGGVIGGLLGGLLFDPIYFFIQGEHHYDAATSRMVGLLVIGAAVGAMIGVVELLARDAWLRMTEGPLAGKEFLIFKDVMHLGASPRSDIYLFNDAGVAPEHALIRTAGDTYEIECSARDRVLALNGRPIQRTRLRHGDRITIGRTSFLFQNRHGN